jgi:regulator of sigma E protease
MHFLLSVIPAAIVLGILIIIHEFGHFLACRMTGVKVEKFSIGFGPEILAWQGKETRYTVSLLPLGGFVKPAGESVSEVEETGAKPGDYLAAPLGARIFIVIAGVLMNYILAFVLFTAIFMMGRPVPGTQIGGFVEGFPAAASGLQKGDRIVSLNEQPVATWKELTDAINAAPSGAVLNLQVDREGQPAAVQVTPKEEEVKDLFGKAQTLKLLGIRPDPQGFKFEKYAFGPALKAAWDTEVFMTVTTHKAIFYLLMGKMSLKTISGPIGIITMTGDAAQMGLPYVLQLTASLSISLAVINLLPIPALDGGHLLFLLIEAIQRKRVSLQVQEKATQVGFFLLMTLMVFILYNDLANVDAFGKIKGIFGKS